MKTCSLTLSYNGAAFKGFAKQPNQLTVQGELECALSLLFKREVSTVCAGRTDAGVHARGQVVSFELTDEEYNAKPARSLLRSLNALTHEAITIHAYDLREDGFSARFDAVSREYRYFLCTEAHPSLFLSNFSWHVGSSLDRESMIQAAHYLEGEHDFKSFCLAASSKDKPTCRNIKSIRFEEIEVLGEHFLQICIIGNAFLHSMVRTIVGSLVMVGKGHREPEWMQKALLACDRSAAGETAPAQGLVFWEVAYDGERLYLPHALGSDNAHV